MIPATSTMPATASTSSTSSTSSSSANQLSDLGSQQDFLQLLVAQMNNQDPLNPMDSSQITSQLAQISTVSGIQNLSTQLSQLLTSISSNQSIQDASLVGQNVLVPGNNLNYAGTPVGGTISLAGAASSVTVTVQDSTGAVVKTIPLGAEAAGNVPFTWDGTNNSGATVAQGGYTFSVSATQGTSAVTASTLMGGQVLSITPGTNGGADTAQIAGLGSFSVSQIQQIQ